MKVKPIVPPRQFEVGRGESIRLKDCARIELEPDEQVTFTAPGGGEYDVVRKAWGFYATPSLNGRLASFGLRAALVRAEDGKYYVMLVERGKEPDFEGYLRIEGHRVVSWLDSASALDKLDKAVNG